MRSSTRKWVRRVANYIALRSNSKDDEAQRYRARFRKWVIIQRRARQ